MKQPFLLILFIVLIGPVAVVADENSGTVLFDLTIPSVESRNYDPTAGATKSNAIIAAPAGILNKVTADFSTIPEEVRLQLEWESPEGTCFEVTAPIEYGGAALRFEWQLGADPGLNNAGNPMFSAPAFTNLEGTEPTLQGALYSYNSAGIKVTAFFSLTAGETVRFTKLSLVGCLPTALNTEATNMPVDHFWIEGRLSQTEGAGVLADAGQWVSVRNKGPAIDPNVVVKARLKRKINRLKKLVVKLRKKGKREAARSKNRSLRKLQRRFRRL